MSTRIILVALTLPACFMLGLISARLELQHKFEGEYLTVRYTVKEADPTRRAAAEVLVNQSLSGFEFIMRLSEPGETDAVLKDLTDKVRRHNVGRLQQELHGMGPIPPLPGISRH